MNLNKRMQRINQAMSDEPSATRQCPRGERCSRWGTKEDSSGLGSVTHHSDMCWVTVLLRDSTGSYSACVQWEQKSHTATEDSKCFQGGPHRRAQLTAALSPWLWRLELITEIVPSSLKVPKFLFREPGLRSTITSPHHTQVTMNSMFPWGQFSGPS